MAMGKPVIGTDMGGIPELIESGVDGFLYPAGDAESLRSLIRLLAEHPGMLPKMGRAARRKAERLFAPSIHYGRLMGLYQEALSQPRKSTPVGKDFKCSRKLSS
jgi:glycosyltransferase involved in cell wall biosynthesis